MDAWLDGCIIGCENWVNAWMDGWMGGQMNGFRKGRWIELSVIPTNDLRERERERMYLGLTPL